MTPTPTWRHCKWDSVHITCLWTEQEAGTHYEAFLQQANPNESHAAPTARPQETRGQGDSEEKPGQQSLNQDGAGASPWG